MGGLDVMKDTLCKTTRTSTRGRAYAGTSGVCMRWTRSNKAAVVRQESNGRIIGCTVHSYVTDAPKGERGSHLRHVNPRC
jgi:hypothetical protein